MSFEGMDVGVMRRVSQGLQTQAQVLDHLISSIESTVGHAQQVWQGQDLTAFAHGWQSSLRTRLLAASSSIHELATTASANADQQDVASNGGTPSNAASGATTGVAGRTPATMLTFAKASENSSTQLPIGWSQVQGDALKALGLDASALHDKATGLDASIYTDGHGHYVIAYAGSAGSKIPTMSRDWDQDYEGIASPVFANASGQTEAAANLARTVVAHVGAGHVQLTGHSLGGRDAAVASVASGAPAVTFNASGVTDEDLLYAKVVSGHQVSLPEYVFDKIAGGDPLRATVDQSKITNYVIANDAVTDGQIIGHAAVGTRTALGKMVPLATDTWSPLDAHNLDNFDGQL